MTTRRAPSPRFKRPETKPGIILTPDDVTILWLVFRHRVLDSKSLYQLFPTRHPQVISRRLRKLWMNGYLDRPLSQNRKNEVSHGSDYLVYAIAREGARFLRLQEDAPIQSQRWTQKNAELKPLSIAHHLATARFMVNLVTAAREVPAAFIRYADEVLPRPTSKKRPAGLVNTIRADVAWPVRGHQQGTAPDQVMALDYEEQRQVLFIEIDQGTETIEPGVERRRSPRFWADTSFLRKMLIYSAAFRAGVHKRQFEIPAFRVLTVTTNADRVAAMQAAFEAHLANGENKTPPGLFLFTDWEQIAAKDGQVLQLPYTNGIGRSVSLLS